MPESSEGHDNTRAAHVCHRCALSYSCEAMALAPGTQHGRGVALRVRVYRPLAVMNSLHELVLRNRVKRRRRGHGESASAGGPPATASVALRLRWKEGVQRVQNLG